MSIPGPDYEKVLDAWERVDGGLYNPEPQPLDSPWEAVGNLLFVMARRIEALEREVAELKGAGEGDQS